MTRRWTGTVLAAALLLAAGTASGGGNGLQPGDPAPEFALPGSDGETYSLKDLKGRAVVIAWYPKAFTGG